MASRYKCVEFPVTEEQLRLIYLLFDDWDTYMLKRHHGLSRVEVNALKQGIADATDCITFYGGLARLLACGQVVVPPLEELMHL